MRYRNGEIPESALVIFKRGRNARDGNFYWGLPPATYRKHLALVARALKRTGRTLSPSDGWSTFRPLAPQVAARKRYGTGAAVPGKSSHGGFWEGRDTAAIDYGNWEWVYAKFGNRAREEFYADCRAVGLTPGMISKARGYPDEPWHVIDLDPWAPVPQGTITKHTTTIPKEVDVIGIYNTDDKNEDTRRALVGEFTFQPISAWYSQSQWPLFGVKNVTRDEWSATKSLVNLRRTSAGMKPIA